MKLTTFLEHAKNWDDVYNNLSSRQLSTTAVGKLFEEFCKYYYLLDPAVKDEYKNVWLLAEVPLHIKQNLNLGSRDYGIDIILQDIDGEYTAVQCKYRSNQDTILNWTADKIANLLADSERCKYKAVFTNASGLDGHTLTKGVELVSLNDLLEIDYNTIENIVNYIINKKSEIKKATPRNYQIEIINKVCTEFNKNYRGQLILPCGTGKTLIGLWIKEKLNAKTTLIVLPSLALLRQTKQEWIKNQKNWQHYLCVCSEQNIDIDKDLIIVREYELGTHVTTSAEDVKEFLIHYSSQGCIIYSTYQSLNVISEAISEINFNFDFIISDEAHKTTGSTATVFGLIHDNDKLPAKHRLYMTATPRVLSKNIKTRLGDDIEYVADMSNPDIYGVEFYRMSFKDAIDQNILVDYKLLVIGVNNEDIHKDIVNRSFVDSNNTIEDFAHNYALVKTMNKHNATHAITFHTTVKRAKEFSIRHRKITNGQGYFDSVSGQQPTSIRAQILTNFKNAPKGVLSNARCLTEGVDVPSIDLIYFSDSKESKIDIVQAVGRALRQSKTKQKTYGYIVVPIFYSPQDGIEKTINGSQFKKLINIVKALCDQDERIQDEINNIRFGQQKSKHKDSHLVIDMGSQDINNIIVLEGFEEALQKSLFDEIISKTALSWDIQFHELCKYLENNKNEYPASENQLYQWVSWQRASKKLGRLSIYRIDKLNNIDFIWNADKERWKQNYDELIQWIGDNQDKSNLYRTWPAMRSKDSQEKKLGIWMLGIRANKRDGLLLKEQQQLLEDINFPFDALESRWQDSYAKLNIYVDHFNKFPQNSPENKLLYQWSIQQVNYYCKNKLSNNQKKQLDKIEFQKLYTKFIEGENIDPWDTRFSELEEFIRINRKIPSYSHNRNSPEENSLSSWINRQRTEYIKKKLSDARVTQLNQLGISLTLQDEKNEKNWNDYYSKIIEYRKSNPNKWPSSSTASKFDIAELKLGRWLMNMKNWYNGHLKKNGPFPQDRYNKLVDIGFDFSIKDFLSLWDENFYEFNRYLDDNHGKIVSCIDGKQSKEYTWLVNQKAAFKKNKLSDYQIEKFKSIGIDVSIPIQSFEKQWTKNFELLKQYINENPNQPIISKFSSGANNSIYFWLYSQKNNYKKNKLCEEKVKLLTSIGINLNI